MWQQHPSERLRYWQKFRHDLDCKSLEEALNDTQHLWSFAPFVNNYLTTDHIENWPTPWELLYENYYCDLAKALGIVYTLWLTKHKPNLEINVYIDESTKEHYNLVFVEQGKYILNYIHDEVVNKKHINKNLKLIKTISSEQLGLDKF
jgi:hypothetical protein